MFTIAGHAVEVSTAPLVDWFRFRLAFPHLAIVTQSLWATSAQPSHSFSIRSFHSLPTLYLPLNVLVAISSPGFAQHASVP